MKHLVLSFMAMMLAIAGVCAQSAPADAPSKKPVVVYLTDNDVNDTYRRVVESRIISTLNASSRFRVLERNAQFIEAMRRDEDYSATGRVRDSQIAAFGMEAGAQYVMIVDMSEHFNEILLALRLIKVEVNEIVGSDEEIVTDANASRLMEAAKNLTQRVIGSEPATPATTPAAPVAGSGAQVETFNVNGVPFEMVKVEGGPTGTFYIGKTEVTQRLWTAVMGSNPSYFRGENKPVETVSWFDCQEFVERLSRLTGRIFRLPTEAEWEYAARGGNRSRNYYFSGSNDLDRVGWYGENSGDTTHPVAQKLDNELGIYDMSGNVWEWCSDLWNGDSSFRVFRGGGCNSSATYCSVADRGCITPGFRDGSLGVRLAL